MNRRRKFGVGIGVSVLIVLILLFAGVLIAPKVVDSEAVKARVRSEIKETAGIDIDFEHLVLDFFPHPHIIIDRVVLSMPPTLKGKAVSVSVYPKILPLFLGKMQITDLRLDSAELDYTLPKKPAAGKATPQPITYYNLAKKIQSVVATLPEFKIPDLDFRVNDSSATLFIGKQKFLELTEFNSHLAGPASGRKITIGCKSNLFKGKLHKSTLDQLATENPWLAGWLEGDFKSHINLKHPLKSAAWGKLKGKEIIYPWKPGTLKINDFAATATTHKINLQSADLTFSGNRLHAAGNMTRSARNVLVDMDISADTIDLNPLIQALKDSSGKERGEKPPKVQAFPVQGNIRLKADQFNIGKFSWNPLQADISLNNDTADVTLKKAILCGISTPGTLKVSGSNIEFDLEAIAQDQKLNPAKTCLVGKTFKADGTYNLKGRFQGHGKAEDLLKTATGQVVFTAKDGRIYYDAILIEVLKFLNPLEVFEGRVNAEDMKQKGFGYHSFGVKAKLQDGKLRYDEAVLHGQPMTVTAAGEHDLQNGRFDLTLLVAPLVTLDRIFEHIPLIGGILEALDTIPLSAKGTLDNIQIYPLAPSAIGYDLAEMMKRTVERPINLIHGGQGTED